MKGIKTFVIVMILITFIPLMVSLINIITDSNVEKPIRYYLEVNNVDSNVFVVSDEFISFIFNEKYYILDDDESSLPNILNINIYLDDNLLVFIKTNFALDKHYLQTERQTSDYFDFNISREDKKIFFDTSDSSNFSGGTFIFEYIINVPRTSTTLTSILTLIPLIFITGIIYFAYQRRKI